MVCDESASDSDGKGVFRQMQKVALELGFKLYTLSTAPAQEFVGWTC